MNIKKQMDRPVSWFENRIGNESVNYLLLSRMFLIFLLVILPMFGYFIFKSVQYGTLHFLVQHLIFLVTDISFIIMIFRGKARQAMALLVYYVVPAMQLEYLLIEMFANNLVMVPVYEIAAMHCLVGVMLIGSFATNSRQYLTRILFLLGVFTFHSLFHLSGRSVPLHSLFGVVIYIVNALLVAFAAYRTGSRLRRVSDERHSLVNRLSNSLDVEKRFFANISHEIRTPLNGILSVASLLKETDVSREQRRLLEILDTNTSALNSMLSNILIHNRLEEGSYPLLRQPSDLEQILQSCAARINRALPEEHPLVSTDLSGIRCGLVLSDIAALSQIVGNLLDNAVKFSSGKIILTAESRELENSRCEITVSVRDFGPGIPEEDRERVFEPYVQLDSGYDKHYQGAGLGLAVARELGILLAARITVSVPDGGGSLFTVQFKAPVADGEYASGSDAGMPDSYGRKVCIADDSGISRIHLEFLLRAEGYTVVTAENGREALDFLEKEHMDLLVLDMQMPVMDGFTCTERIRTHEKPGLRKIPILAVTGYSFELEEQRMRSLGINEVLIKPFAEKDFLDKVTQLVAVSG